MIYKILYTIFDYILYTKLYIEESSSFKTTYNISQYYFHNLYHYINQDVICNYCDTCILEVKLFNKHEPLDITNIFINLLNKDILSWNNIIDNIKNRINNIDDIVDDDLHIITKYKIDNKIYRIIYNYDTDIKFPPYSKDEIHEYNNNITYKHKIIHAEIIKKDGLKEDITSLIEEYSGPLYNFYHDKNHKIHIRLIKNNYYENILNDIEIIYITDSYGDTKEFDKTQILKL